MLPMSQPYHWACDQGKGLQGCEPRVEPESQISCSRKVESIAKCERMNTPTPK